MFKNPLFLKHNFCLNLIKTIYDDNIMNTNFPHRIEYDLKSHGRSHNLVEY